MSNVKEMIDAATNLAVMAHAYYSALRDGGFDNDIAIDLTKDLVRTLMSPKEGTKDEQGLSKLFS